MTEEKKYKGSKTKVESLVKKLIKDNMYDPNDEEHWLIDEYDRFNHHAKESLNVFEKYYGAVWDDLKKMRRMNIEIFFRTFGKSELLSYGFTCFRFH